MPSCLSILIIGSSHLATPGYLITSLHDSLLAQGATVHTLGVRLCRPGMGGEDGGLLNKTNARAFDFF